MDAHLEVAPKKGQFQVLVDSETVLSRQGGLFAMLMRKGWPSNEDVLAAVRAAGE